MATGACILVRCVMGTISMEYTLFIILTTRVSEGVSMVHDFFFTAYANINNNLCVFILVVFHL